MAHDGMAGEAAHGELAADRALAKGRWPWLAFAALALALCALWFFVWPQDRAVGKDFAVSLIIRWGHLATWAFLFLGALYRALGKPGSKLSGRLFALGGFAYAAFILAAYVL